MRFLLSIFCIVVASCGDQFIAEKDAEVEVVENCIVVYSKKEIGSCDLYRTWTLVGIVNRMGHLQYPPCFQRGRTVTQEFITIAFDPTRQDDLRLQKYPFNYGGAKLLGWGYGGSYQLGDNGDIDIEIGASLLSGYDERLVRFENNYLNLLRGAIKFEINGNELTINCGDSKLLFYSSSC